MKLFVDLGSGLGGASEAFTKDNEWVVLRFDNSILMKDVAHTYILNYVDEEDLVIAVIQNYIWQFNINEHDLVIWASPECKEWSNGYNSKKCKMRREGEEFVPDFSQINSITNIINYFRPKYYIIENVMGGVEFLNDILGQPAQVHRPWIFWGVFPKFRIEGLRRHKSTGDVHSKNPLRYHLKSKIPIEISRSLKNAIENQTTLGEYMGLI